MPRQREGFEPSEIFAATAMFFSKAELESAKKNIFDLIEFFPLAAAKLTNAEGGVMFGSGEEQTAFESYYEVDPGPFPEGWQITNMAQGISAALAIKEWLLSKGKGTKAKTVYMTGKQWPDEVDVFNIDLRGFNSYNSSDIIIKPEGNPKSYMGVSLKKKPKADDMDPTMINKAFDTVLGKDKQFDDIKKEIVEVRANYFGGKVKEAARLGHIHLGRHILTKSNEWLFSGHSSDDRVIHNMAKDRAFIDTKGSMKMKEIMGPDDSDNPDDWGKANPRYTGWDNYGDKKLGKSELKSRTDTMRAWVNKQLATDRTLYNKMLGVMNDYADLFGEQLISVTLRTDVIKEIKRKLRVEGIGNLDFGFALVTGLGKVQKVPASQQIAKKAKEIEKELLSIPAGKAYDIECVLEGLAHMDAPSSGTNDYQFKVKKKEEPHVDDDGPAKLIFDLEKNGTPILAMELRFKGGFTSQPQFFGTMTKEFKDVLKGKCI